jgi:hypothetical protein
VAHILYKDQFLSAVEASFVWAQGVPLPYRRSVINKALIVCIDFLFTGKSGRVYVNNATGDVFLSTNNNMQTWSLLEDIADAAGELLPRNICHLV